MIEKTYWLTRAGLDALQAAVDVAQNKIAKLGLESPSIQAEPDLEAEGLYKVVLRTPRVQVEGWTEAGNVLATGDGRSLVEVDEALLGHSTAQRLLEVFSEAPPHCDHCKTRRVKVKAHIFANLTTGEIMQIGSGCAKAYFGFDLVKATEVIAKVADEAERWAAPRDQYALAKVGPITLLVLLIKATQAGLRGVVREVSDVLPPRAPAGLWARDDAGIYRAGVASLKQILEDWRIQPAGVTSEDIADAQALKSQLGLGEYVVVRKALLESLAQAVAKVVSSRLATFDPVVFLALALRYYPYVSLDESKRRGTATATISDVRRMLDAASRNPSTLRNIAHAVQERYIGAANILQAIGSAPTGTLPDDLVRIAHEGRATWDHAPLLAAAGVMFESAIDANHPNGFVLFPSDKVKKPLNMVLVSRRYIENQWGGSNLIKLWGPENGYFIEGFTTAHDWSGGAEDMYPGGPITLTGGKIKEGTRGAPKGVATMTHLKREVRDIADSPAPPLDEIEEALKTIIRLKTDRILE